MRGIVGIDAEHGDSVAASVDCEHVLPLQSAADVEDALLGNALTSLLAKTELCDCKESTGTSTPDVALMVMAPFPPVATRTGLSTIMPSLPIERETRELPAGSFSRK